MNLDWGEFFGGIAGDPVLRFLSQGRNMQVVCYDCYYRDPDGRVWLAQVGDIVDGASIPKALWTVYGGPFEGIYRTPSVFHDRACSYYETIAQRREADLMFYRACLCAGCTSEQANVLWLGVSMGTTTAEREGRDHGDKAFNVIVLDRPGNWH